MSKLKCCPFCGGEAVIDREDIFCDYCHLSMRIDDRLYNGEAETYEEAKQQAIENWNTRTPMANIVEKFEEKTEFLKDCTKYGNESAEQQEKSYSTMMMYEVADLVDDLIGTVKQEINNGLE